MRVLVYTTFILLFTVSAAWGHVDLHTVTTGLDDPVSVTGAGDGSGRLFIVGQDGEIVIWDGDQILAAPFLDIKSRVSCCSERGLLGLAFHPDYTSNGLFFVNYTDNSGNTVIARFEVTANPDVADPSSEIKILTIDQPFTNHNGGDLAFGADGFLYIGTGDGGSGGDPGNRAQSLGELLGKMLRIDIDGELPYGIPDDNPFIDDPTARDEIWAYGLRNPWRFGFDRVTGDLLVGDVGQNDIEEIDFQLASSGGGENYGWRLMEGSECFDPPNNCNDGTLVLPILEYLHFDGGFQGCAVIGGYRHRGTDFPTLDGLYFYSDNCTGKLWAGVESGGDWASSELLDTSWNITSFGEDDDGNVFAVGSSRLLRLVDDDPLCVPAMSQDTYTAGDTLTVEELRLLNLGASPVTLRVELLLTTPTGGPISIVDKGGDGSLTIPAGLEQDFGPLTLAEVPPAAPLGEYQMTCRLSEPSGGAILSEQTATFTVE